MEMKKEELFAALDRFTSEFMHGCPVVQSTLPGFMDPRNELILKVYKYAIVELGYKRD